MRYLFVLVFLMCGCAERQAQTAVQTSLTALASGLNQADDVYVSGRIATAAEETRTSVASEHPDARPDEMMSLYIEAMHPWYTAVDRMEEVRVILQTAQVAVTTWIATSVLPADWGVFCTTAGEQFELLVQAIDDVTDEEIPPEIANAGPAVTLVCGMAESYFTGRE